jgi:hypothetical protein
MESLYFFLMHKCRQCLNELFNEALKHDFISVFEERYEGTGCQYLEVFVCGGRGGGQLGE